MDRHARLAARFQILTSSLIAIKLYDLLSSSFITSFKLKTGVLYDFPVESTFNQLNDKTQTE